MFLLALAILININTATLQQLDELTGIGPKYAQAIIDARPFYSVDDLEKVKGIGPKTLQKIKDQGLACVECQTQQVENIQPKNVPPTATSLEIQNPVPVIIYSSGIFINEILPNPAGADETEEWIELYNSNNFDVDLGGWQIQDTFGTPTTFTIPKDTQILANNFLVFKRPDTKIMLNNDTDGLNLLTPDKKITDSVNFTKASLNQSYNKTTTGWIWSKTLTLGSKNIISVATKTLPKSQKSDNNKIELTTADLSQALPLTSESTNPWFLFFTVLALTIISAVIVLLIKLRLKPNT